MSSRIHFRNLAFNWGGHASTLLVMFFLSPYIVGKLDAVSYGIWSLLNVLTGYMGIFDLGVRASVGRHVALYLGKGDKHGVDETIRAGFGFFSLVGGLILLVGILLGWLFPVLFKGISHEHYVTVRVLLPLMVVNVWLSAIAAIYSSVLAAHDRFDVARGVDMVVLVVRTIGTIYVLLMGWGLWGLTFTVIAGNVCAIIGNRIYAGKVHAGLRSFPFLYSRERLGELFGYGLGAFIVSVAIKIIGQSDLVIVGMLMSISDVREYSVGAMLVYYSSTFIDLIGDTFFPSVQKAVSGGILGEVSLLFFRQLRLALCTGILIFVGLVFYSESFIRLWMLQDGFDQRAVAGSAAVMSVLALSKFPLLFIVPCQRVLAALGYIRFNAIIAISEALTNVAVSLFFVLVLDLGLVGVAAGTLVARLLLPTVLVPFFLFHKIQISLSSFIFKVILPGGTAAALFSLFCMLLIRFWNPISWTVFGAHIFASIIVWIVLSTILLLPSDIYHRGISLLLHRVK